MNPRLAPYLPALALAVTAGYSATFPTAGRLGAETLTLVVLAVLAWLGAPRHRDPLGLCRSEASSVEASSSEGRGPSGGWGLVELPWFAVLAVIVSFALSPVPRAGLTAVLRLPLYLLVPGAVAVCWREQEDRRRGTLALGLVVALLSAWALFQWWRYDDPRPALPLGHHNLLALWLVAVVPLAIWPVASASATLAQRAVAALAAMFGIGTLVATRSLAGALGMVAFLVVWAASGWLVRLAPPARRRAAILAGVGLVLVLIPLFPRLSDIAAGRDPSVRARLAYVEAAVQGAAERPWSGWGPGAAAWTVAAFFEPVPGVHPPGQVLSDLHSVALQLPYELGVPTALLVVILSGFWLRRRFGRLGAGVEAGTLAGAVGWGVALSVSGVFSVEALWLAGAVLIGAAQATYDDPTPAALGASPASHFKTTLAIRLICGVLVLAHLPVLDALRHHGAARRSEERRDEALAEAAKLDGLPLYEAQRAWVGAVRVGDGSEEGLLALDEALHEAATRAHGVAAFWLATGVAAVEGGSPGSAGRRALERACSLEPLGAMAPFFRFLAEPEHPEAARFAARAVLLEPRLLASVALARHPPSGLIREIREWPGLPPGWQEGMVATAEGFAELPPPPDAAETSDLGLTVDGDPAISLSLFVFGRQPMPGVLVRVPLLTERLGRIDLPSAGTLAEAEGAFRSRSCSR